VVLDCPEARRDADPAGHPFCIFVAGSPA